MHICIADNCSQVQTNGKHTFYLHESTVKAAKEVVMDRQVRSNLCTESLHHKWDNICLVLIIVKSIGSL